MTLVGCGRQAIRDDPGGLPEIPAVRKIKSSQQEKDETQSSDAVVSGVLLLQNINTLSSSSLESSHVYYGGYYRAHEDIPSPGVGN
nr:hypothetical protein Iba_chr11bCG17010 [Ipomoea batatas]